jgi:enoyl-CoA hydratase
MSVDASTLRVERDGDVLVLTLHRPDKLNALSTSVLLELRVVLEHLRVPAPPRAIVVTGRGRAFSAGADIDEMAAMASAAEFSTFVELAQGVFDVLARLGIPSVAAVNGPALGGGCELALACDLRVMAASARLGVPEILLGELPGAGGTQRLPRLVPPAVARRMLLLGDPLNADECLRWGLVNAVVPDGAALETAMAWAGRLARLPRQALAEAKTLVDVALNADLAAGLDAERAAVVRLFDTEDRREGMAAFVDKRQPSFTGT